MNKMFDSRETQCQANLKFDSKTVKPRPTDNERRTLKNIEFMQVAIAEAAQTSSGPSLKECSSGSRSTLNMGSLRNLKLTEPVDEMPARQVKSKFWRDKKARPV